VTVRRVLLFVALTSVAATAGATAVSARTANVLEFRPVLAALPPEPATSTTAAPADRVTAALAVASCEPGAVLQLPAVPTTRITSAGADDCVVLGERGDGHGATRYYLGPAGVTTAAVKSAKAEFVSGAGWTVKLAFTKAGSAAWDELAEQQFQKQVAVVVNGRVVSAPTVQPNEAAFESFGGTAVISGDFTENEVRALARRIRAANGR
jgi:preprotein translocase subunit SecD